ncbi:hypothetical protein VPH35_126104 [Triticum aestivum]
MGAPTRLRRYIFQPLVVSSLRPNPMEPPRRTKRPAGDGEDDDAKAASKAPRYDGAARDSFVERAARGGTKNKEEPWLGATDVDGESPGPAATKRARKAMQRQEEDERILEGVVGSRAVFDIKKRIAGLLQPGETVPHALRRLKGDKRGGGKGMDEDEAARCTFDELMDASAELVRRGDLDAYTDDREAFERGAWDYEHARRRRRLAREAPEDDEADQQTAAATRDYYVDMFGDDAVGAGSKTAAESSSGHAANPEPPAAQPDASGATTEEEAGGVVGWDYVYDPSSAYYYSGSTGHYYDAASGCYWSASAGTWFS